MALARSLDRPDRDTKRRLRLWLRLYAATSVIEREMRRFLRTRFATTLPRFDLMAALERAPEGLTMGELSRRLMVSGGGGSVSVSRPSTVAITPPPRSSIHRSSLSTASGSFVRSSLV
jgi:hypothetical protein